MWDFTCRDTFASYYIDVTSSTPGYAAAKGEAEKKKRCDLLQSRYTFVTIALETTGVWRSEGLNVIQEFGRRTTKVTGEKRTTKLLIQRPSVTLQRGNVILIMGSFLLRRSWRNFTSSKSNCFEL